jgi:hypothetical protein
MGYKRTDEDLEELFKKIDVSGGTEDPHCGHPLYPGHPLSPDHSSLKTTTHPIHTPISTPNY